MLLHEALAILETRDAPRTQRDTAATSLLEHLRTLAARPMSDGQGGRFVLAADQRDEVVQLLAIKILDRSPLPAIRAEGPITEGRCIAYVRSMGRNAAVDLFRKTLRERPIGEPVVQATEADDEDARSIAESRELLHKVYAQAEAERPPRYRADLRQAWDQLSALVFDGQPMSTILVAVRDGDEPEETTRARVLQAHHRLRKALLTATDAMGESGALDAGQLELVRQVQRKALVRCQRRPR